MPRFRRITFFAACLYLSMLPFGVFGIVWPVEMLTTDSASLEDVLIKNGTMLRYSICSALMTQVLTILLALTFFELFHRSSRSVAASMVALTGVGAALAIGAQVPFLVAITLPESPQIGPLIEAYRVGILFASAFWGLWLLPLALLLMKTKAVPAFIGWLIVLAGAGYLLDFGLGLLKPQIDVTVAQFTFLGEVLLPLWMLARGVNISGLSRRLMTAQIDNL